MISLCRWRLLPPSVHLTNISWLNLLTILGRKLGDIFRDCMVSGESIYWDKPIMKTVSISISKKIEITTSWKFSSNTHQMVSHCQMCIFSYIENFPLFHLFIQSCICIKIDSWIFILNFGLKSSIVKFYFVA